LKFTVPLASALSKVYHVKVT